MIKVPSAWAPMPRFFDPVQIAVRIGESETKPLFPFFHHSEMRRRPTAPRYAGSFEQLPYGLCITDTQDGRPVGKASALYPAVVRQVDKSQFHVVAAYAKLALGKRGTRKTKQHEELFGYTEVAARQDGNRLNVAHSRSKSLYAGELS